MVDFDILFGMDWVQACFASIDCQKRVVKFNFHNNLALELGGSSILTGRIVSFLKACKIIYKGCYYHIVRVKDLESDIPPIQSVPIVKDFPEVFPDDLPKFLPSEK